MHPKQDLYSMNDGITDKFDMGLVIVELKDDSPNVLNLFLNCVDGLNSQVSSIFSQLHNVI